MKPSVKTSSLNKAEGKEKNIQDKTINQVMKMMSYDTVFKLLKDTPRCFHRIIASNKKIVNNELKGCKISAFESFYPGI